ncbi:GH3 auxin-responsive promoter [Peptoclostridium litorale DSM 5388]|uniref:Putative auxin-responsive-like protein n=1 Tax=Peptoclostridium litorale DSM 5388 TaxID=1121324 RepID=A0A069RIN6_PEPLI|nr:GH3 auxin-responsive promoter family protein [Peptoclostridium litorale]KDR96623.1 putative auxin-responsive-like protein [Peptoclostridium litorale DSM 5388]SIN68349.1 GH3 auxin-responsive promoter [Peptoclostridium litorale DSM 5388]
MSNPIISIANRILLLLYSKKSIGFHNATGNVENVQEHLIKKVIKKNQDSLFGKSHDFKNIRSINEYRALVPIRTYDDFLPYVKKIENGIERVLTAEKVLRFEESSGTSSASKLIPYTHSLKNEFLRGIAPWIYDLYSFNKGLVNGKSYWSITPVKLSSGKSHGKTPIGFEEDSQYFGFLEKFFLSLIFAVPKELIHVHDISSFRYITLLFLLNEKSLSLISIWNPTFLILLLDAFKTHSCSLVADLEAGTINPPGKIQPDIHKILSKKLKPNPKRASEISSILKKWECSCPRDADSIYEEIWPNLQVISCWTDANAAIYTNQLKALFPNVFIQGKGLLSTEGFISLPLVGHEGCMLSIRSHFFEFLRYDVKSGQVDDYNTVLAHELEIGQIYSVIISTGGGFYRYRLMDLIQVLGFTKGCPRVRFVGKEGNISDYFGEKLNEYHVHRVFKSIFDKYEISPSFYMMAPESDIENSKYYYSAFIELEDGESKAFSSSLNSAAKEFEKQLNENFHYKYCRALGQLEHLRLYILKEKPANGKSAIEIYTDVCRLLGQREGNVKPVALHKKAVWLEQFKELIYKEEEASK